MADCSSRVSSPLRTNRPKTPREMILIGLACSVLALSGCPDSGGPSVASLGANLVSSFNKARGFDREVYTVQLATDGSGDIYVGGAFRIYNSMAQNRLVRINADGSIDTGFAVGTGLNGSVQSLASATDGSGDVYVGGGFSSYNGTAVNRLVRLNANGSIDTGFNVGTGFNDFVFTVAPATDGSGDVYVGGQFTSYNGTAVNHLVRLNADGSIDTGFTVGTGLDGSVQSLASATDGSGDVYVGGDFTDYNGTAVTRLVRLNADGSIDTGFNTGTGMNDHVYTVAPLTDGSGDVYVGGRFTDYSGMAVNRVVRLNANGSIDAGFIVGSGMNNNVSSLVPAADGSGDVYVGGGFTSYNGTAVNRLVRLNADGTIDSGFNIGTGVDQDVYMVALPTDGSGDVYVGGRFTGYNSTGVNRLGRLNADGSIDTGFTVGTGFNNLVFTVAPATDGSGDVYVGGRLTRYNGTAVNRLVRLNADGSIDTGFNIGTGFDNFVFTVAPATDGSGDVYVGGQFTSYNGTAVNNLVRLNADGSIDTGFNVGTGTTGMVRSMAFVQDGSGDVYVGGWFTSYNGTAKNYLVRLNADGSIDTGFNIGTGMNDFVWRLASATDGSGDVYVGGDFTDYNGTAVNRLVRLNADGSIDSGFNAGTGADNIVSSLVSATDGSGDVYVGGSFTDYNGTAVNRLVRLNADGSIDSGFNVGTGADGDVQSLAPTSDGSGDVYVGGGFTGYNGTTVNRLVRLNADGTIDSGFNVGTGADQHVMTVAPAIDNTGDVFVGGDFTTFNGVVVDRLMRLHTDGSVS